jgi:hypothetical protein
VADDTLIFGGSIKDCDYCNDDDTVFEYRRGLGPGAIRDEVHRLRNRQVELTVVVEDVTDSPWR